MYYCNVNSQKKKDMENFDLFDTINIFILLAVLFHIYKWCKADDKRKLRETDAIFITGCDSGIGYTLARYCQELGMTVFAGCLNLGVGAYQLEELKNVHVIPIDVTNSMSVKTATSRIHKILADNSSTSLKTVVNNAGVMIFGEFAWQTDAHILQQIQVNLVGAMNVTRMLLPLVIKSQGRIINVCSHCSLEALPGLSVYAASKTGLLAWSDALRMEMLKFKVPVISLIPGSFPFETNILSNQASYASEMQDQMSKSDWELYESYFREYNSYLSSFNREKKIEVIKDEHLYKMFDHALRSPKPKIRYCYSNWRYWFYHALFKVTPTPVHDYLVTKFINMPNWKGTIN